MSRWAYSVAEVSRALGGDGRKTVRCPVHGDRNPSLSIGIGREGQPLAYCFAGCNSVDVLAELETRGLIARDADGGEHASQRVAPAPVSEIEPAVSKPSHARAKAAGIWGQTRPVTADDPAGHYLLSRNCRLPASGSCVRWAPNVEHWPTRTRHPAMVSRISNTTTGESLSLHLTFLKPDGSGKAPLDKPKLVHWGLSAAGVIRFDADDEVTTGLGVGEGIETTASLPAPAWACVSAGNLGKLPVLDGVEALTIAVDADPAGRDGADKCARRWHAAGREVRLITAEARHGRP